MKTVVRTRPLFKPKKSLCMILIVLFLSIFFLFFFANREVIYEGIYINGLDVGGMNQQEAVGRLEQIMEPVLKKQGLKFVFSGSSWEIPLKDIGGAFDYYGAVRSAYRIGHGGGLLRRINEIYTARRKGEHIQLEFQYNVLAIRALLEGIDRQIAVSPVNAIITREGKQFSVMPEVEGMSVDIEAALEQAGKELKRLDWSPKALPVSVKMPEITSIMLEPINTRWGFYSTAFDPGNTDRSENIRIAACSIEGTVLKPGEVFSFNEATGPRLEENGYREAPVIFNGELVPGPGGGVCQVSSTLYNAILYSNLETVERHPHSIPSAYISKGRDAAVVDEIMDFRLRNNTEGCVYIASWIYENRIYAAVYGKEREHDIRVELREEIVEIIEADTFIETDFALAPGEEEVDKQPRKGYKIKTYRQVFRDDELEKEEMLSFDFYKPQNGLIRRGPSPGERGAGGDINNNPESN